MSSRGTRAAVDVARAHGLPVDDPVVLHDLFSLRVHLRPSPVVVRVPTWTTTLIPAHTRAVGHELAVVDHLVERGAPVAAPSTELPPGPHERDGFVLSLWCYAPPDEQVVLHGDAHPGNLLRSGGDLLWIDFEQVARGPREWDMATMHDEDLALTRLSADPDRLRTCLMLRDLQVVLCLAGLDDVFGDGPGWADGLRSCLDGVRARLPTA